MRVLDPLPLLDEQALLAACAAAEPPIPSQHASYLWKLLLRGELDQYHPGYLERLHSRLASRTASRNASRLNSRRPSIGSNSEASSTAESKQPIEEGVENDNDAEAAVGSQERKADDAAAASSMGPASPRSVSSSGESGTVESDAARFAQEAAARRKLEAEDDARLEGLSSFPRSRFNPSEAELADPTSAVHNVTQVTPALVPSLPGRMYPLLASKFSLLTSRLQSHKTSADGSTTKLLIRLQDGQHIESVIMRHKQQDIATGRAEQRITLCVSSQVGCAMACSFCATGTMGMRGNLYAGEILEQLLIANRFEKIRNIVFMGMGEPLKNYEAVKSAIQGMTDGNRFGLAPSRITLSTVGIISNMLQLTRDLPTIQLALSLHAPTQELRQQIVPTAKSYPLEKMMEAVDYFIQRSGKRILIEYVMLDGVNASEKEAHELGALLKGKQCMINLIPYNSTSVAANYRAPPKEVTARFQLILQQQYNLFTTVRVEMGADIDGACGQLALENQKLDPSASAASAESSVKPRGLFDDDALPSSDLLPAAAASSSSCSSSSVLGHSPDIEDLAPVAKKKEAAGMVKRRKAPATTNGEDEADAGTATAASSAPPAATTSGCCGADATCDCESTSAACSSGAAASPCSSAAAAASSAASPAASDSDADDDLTIGEILQREGLARRSSFSGAPPKPLYLNPREAEQIKVQTELAQSWADRESNQFAVILGALAVGVALTLLLYSGASMPSFLS